DREVEPRKRVRFDVPLEPVGGGERSLPNPERRSVQDGAFPSRDPTRIVAFAQNAGRPAKRKRRERGLPESVDAPARRPGSSRVRDLDERARTAERARRKRSARDPRGIEGKERRGHARPATVGDFELHAPSGGHEPSGGGHTAAVEIGRDGGTREDLKENA